MLVQQEIAADFIARMKEKTARIRLGNPLDRATKMGPVVSQEHMERVLSAIERGQQEARLLVGGGRAEALPQGCFVEPTIFESDNAAWIAREEIFGPVVTVIPFTDE